MVLFDGRFVRKTPSGIGRYSTGLLEGLGLVRSPGRPRLGVLVEPGSPLPGQVPDATRFEFVTVDYGPFGIRNQIQLPLLLKRLGVRLYHAPDLFAPIARPAAVKTVITVHDMIPFRFRDLLRRSLKCRFFPIWRAWVQAQLAHADAIVTVSSCSRDDIIRFSTTREEKIRVIHNGALTRSGVPRGWQERRSAGAAPRTILCVGRFDPYKNVEALIRAVPIIQSQGLDVRLVLVGPLDARYPEPMAAAAALGLGDRVVFAGSKGDADLTQAYHQSDVFAFPSLYEGFGLPPLEAMAHGVPVVAHNGSCMPEILADSALLVDARRPECLAAGIVRVLTDEALRRDLSLKGVARAAEFTWEKSAARHLSLYSDLVDGRAGTGQETEPIGVQNA